MSIRNAELGGTDITFGEAGLESADWNDTFDALAIRQKTFVFADATEETTTSASFTTIKTGTLTADFPSNHFILGFKVSAELKHSGAGIVQARVTVDGNLVGSVMQVVGGTYTVDTDEDRFTTTAFMNNSSYTIDFDLLTQTGGTAFARNITITFYVIQGTWATESPAFS